MILPGLPLDLVVFTSVARSLPGSGSVTPTGGDTVPVFSSSPLASGSTVAVNDRTTLCPGPKFSPTQASVSVLYTP